MWGNFAPVTYLSKKLFHSELEFHQFFVQKCIKSAKLNSRFYLHVCLFLTTDNDNNTFK